MSPYDPADERGRNHRNLSAFAAIASLRNGSRPVADGPPAWLESNWVNYDPSFIGLRGP